MSQHFTILGVLFLCLGLIGLAGAVLVLAVFSLVSAAVGCVALQESDLPFLAAFIPAGIGLLVGAILALTTLPNLVAAYAILAGRSWARLATLVVGVLNLPGFPLGTAVGIYAIWAFVQEESPPTEANRSTGCR